MLKLYKRVLGYLRYHEAWAHDETVTEHWGIVGERGQFTEHKVSHGASADQAVKEILRPAVSAGFSPIEPENHAVLVIEYAIEGHGTASDIDKRHALEERMNESLGWTGLGHCDGGSIGSGTMEVFCIVVDFAIAKGVIEADLEGTNFNDYNRICTNEELQ